MRFGLNQIFKINHTNKNNAIKIRAHAHIRFPLGNKKKKALYRRAYGINLDNGVSQLRLEIYLILLWFIRFQDYSTHS